MKRIYCFLFFFVFTATFSQQKNTVIEDDYETLKDKIRLYFNSSVDRSLVYAEQMAKSSNYEHLAFANGAMASLLQIKGETAKSKEKYKLALGYLDKMPDSKEKKRVTADVYNNGGLAEWYRGNHGAALEIFQSGIKVSSQIGDIKQIIKFKANIALLNESVGNYKLAIKNDREIIDFVDKNENLFTSAELLNRRSNVYLGLGSAYESYYIDKRRIKLLDSSEYFYKKAIEYSGNFPYTEATSRLSLGNIASWRKDYKSAERIYFEVVNLALKNKQLDLLSSAYYNLGDLFQSNGKYYKALPFFKKTDSLQILYHSNEISYLRSNYYQARIYNKLNMPELAHNHSRIYLDLFDKLEGKLNEERVKVNYKQGEDNLKAEMLSIEKKYKEDSLLNRRLNVFYVILFCGIVFLLIKNSRDKKKSQRKIIELISDVSKNNKK
jgi:tetratricopeptide (TPR) repeat protein